MHIPILGKNKSSKTTSKPLPTINTSISDYKRPPPVNSEVSGSSTSSNPSSIAQSRSDSNQSSFLEVGTSTPGNRSRSHSRSIAAVQEYSEPPSSPSSISKRQFSEKLKQTPSSYVRNSRVYSNDFDGIVHSDSYNSLTNLQSKNVNSFTNVLLASKSVPPELSPIVTLFNSHGYRTYYSGTLLYHNNGAWDEVSAKLTGNELSIWSDLEDDDFKPKYFNLFDYHITLDTPNEVLKFSNDLNENFYSLILKATSKEAFSDWVTALYLLNFEKLALNEAFTAVILSLIGPKLSDIHILLSKKKYPKFEWCNIRLPQINHKWLKCYVAIYPSTSKKTGKIEIYQLDKVSKKNLICYISDVTNAYNIFPENVNMIEFNSIMKLNGDVFVNSKFEHLFAATNGNFSKSHQRATSQSSFFSISSSPPSSPKIKSSSSFIKTNYIYLMPQSHPGVQEIETMIRNYIPILDAFKLYGRPKQLNSDKFDKLSLLFGMPALPHYEYLSFHDALNIVRLKLPEALRDNWSFTEWNNEFQELIEFKMANENYKGHGNVGHLYKSLELDDSDLMSLKSLPEINLPEGATNEFSPSPMPGFSPPGSPSIDGQLGPAFGSPRLGTSPLTNAYPETTTTPSTAMRKPSPSISNVSDAGFNFENLNSIDRIASPVAQLGELDEPINFHPYRQKA